MSKNLHPGFIPPDRFSDNPDFISRKFPGKDNSATAVFGNPAGSLTVMDEHLG